MTITAYHTLNPLPFGQPMTRVNIMIYLRISTLGRGWQNMGAEIGADGTYIAHVGHWDRMVQSRLDGAAQWPSETGPSKGQG